MEQHTTRTNTEDQAIDLSVLLRRMGRALTRLWPVCLALVVLCAALMGWRGHRSFRPMYRSEAVFSVNLSFVGGTDLSGYSQYYNKSAAQQVADTFPYLLTSDRMQELLLQRLGVTYLNGVISSSAIKDTSFFVLTVESPSPQDAYDILCAVIDVNGLQIDGAVDDVCSPYPIDEKFKAFGFHVIEVDGHDFDALKAAFDEAKQTKGQPTAIIAKTVKGKGVSFMENQCSWHGTAPNDEQYAQAMEELEKAGESLCQK